MNRYTICALLAAAIAAALLPSETPEAPEAPADRARVRFPGGRRFTYAFALRHSAALRLDGAAAPLATEVHAAGQLRLRVFGPRGDAVLVGASFDALDFDARALGQRFGEEARERLVGPEALLEIGADGAFRRIAFDAADEEGLFPHLLRAVLLHLQVTSPAEAAPAWAAVEESPAGAAEVAYARDPATPGALYRSRLRYRSLAAAPPSLGGGDRAAPWQDLRSAARIELDPSGPVRAVSEAEELHTRDRGHAYDARVRFELRLLREEAFQGSPPSRGPGVPFATPVLSPALKRSLLAQRVAGMTAERAEGDLLVHAAAGFVPDGERWFWQVTGLVEQKPEVAKRLQRLFGTRALGTSTRALILDVLAAVGHAPAQASLRAALSSPALRARPDELAALVQHCVFLRDPEPETVRLLQGLYRGAAGAKLRRAVLYPLGTALGRAVRRRGDAESRALHEALRRELRAARAPEDRRALLAALGNAGLAESAAAIAAFGRDPDERVRVQVAWSLRNLQTETGRNGLRALLVDAEETVRDAARRSLRARPVAPPIGEL